MPIKADLADLELFCETDKERGIMKSVSMMGTAAAAADNIGMSERAVRACLARLRKRRNDSGYQPTVPAGHEIAGVSTLINEDGQKIQWIKTRQDAALQREALQEFVEELTKGIKPRKRQKQPKKIVKDLMVAYPIGDLHVGMYSWHEETGGDWDLKLAERLLTDAVDYLVDNSPDAEEGLLVNLGDFLHIDNRTNKTPASGHVLDVDTRYGLMTRVAPRMLAHATERLLEKHKRVRVVNVPGNHDPDSTYWLDAVLSAWFRKDPRVTVDMSPAKFLFHQFGRNMICMTHGDRLKLAELPGIMAALQPEIWGTTDFRYAWTGHVHHSQTVIGKENRGAIAESFGVLAPNDAYGASMGFKSQREMQAISLHKEGGEVARVKYSVRP